MKISQALDMSLIGRLCNFVIALFVRIIVSGRAGLLKIYDQYLELKLFMEDNKPFYLCCYT